MAKKLKLKTLTAVSATSTAAPLSATNLWVKSVTIQNLSSSSNEVYFGDSTVTSSNGIELPVGASASIDSNCTPSSEQREINLKDIYVRCASAETANVRISYLAEVDA